MMSCLCRWDRDSTCCKPHIWGRAGPKPSIRGVAEHNRSESTCFRDAYLVYWVGNFIKSLVIETQELIFLSYDRFFDHKMRDVLSLWFIYQATTVLLCKFALHLVSLNVNFQIQSGFVLWAAQSWPRNASPRFYYCRWDRLVTY